MQYDVERLLDALRRVESRGNRFAVSPAGAKGPYQFMPATAQEYGLKGSDVFDETKSRNAARKKLSGLINRYGIERGIAAYNLGEGNLEKLKGNYKKVAETAQYVPKVLGAYNAGFKPRTEQKEQLPMLPPLEPQPEVKQAVDMPEPVIKQTQGGKLLDFSRLKSQQQQQALLAKLNGNVDWGDPNAMVSGRVVQTNPITALANALRTGMGAYHATKADKIGQDLDMQKAQALEQLLQSGQQPDINALVQAGAIGPEQLAEALANRAAKSAEYQLGYDAQGNPFAFNKGTSIISTPKNEKGESYSGGSALYSVPAVEKREGVKQALKGTEYTDSEGKVHYGPAVKRDPSYGQYLTSTGMMPVPGGSQPVVGQSKADEAAAVAAAKAPIEVQQSGQIAQDKADIESRAKLKDLKDTDTYKKTKSADEALDAISEAEKLLPNATGSYIGKARDVILGAGGFSTDAAKNASRLEVLGGILTAKVPRMEGPQSDADRKAYEAQAGKVGDATIPIEQRMAALEEVKRIHQKYATESFETKPSAYNPDAMRQKYGIK